MVHVGTKIQIKSLKKAIIYYIFNLNWLLLINKHNILQSEIDMKWLYAILRDLKTLHFPDFVFFGCKIDDCRQTTNFQQ